MVSILPGATRLRSASLFACILLGALTLLFWSGCGTSTGSMQKKLEKIGQEDLQDIIAEIPAQARQAKLARPFFKIGSYREFHGDTAIVFQAMATVYFFYLDPSLDLCQMRKYRFKRTAGMWDRYEVKLVHFPTNYSGIGVE
jgi:hypothetical protein